MKLKLSNSEMVVFAQTVEAVCLQFDGMNAVKDGLLIMEIRLYKTIFDRINLDLKRKLLEYKKQYKHTLAPEQAIAYYMVVHKANLGSNAYTINFNHKLCNNILQQFS